MENQVIKDIKYVFNYYSKEGVDIKWGPTLRGGPSISYDGWHWSVSRPLYNHICRAISNGEIGFR